jgi:predicted RNA-binding Zn-ribbon protein involved in translation (DUF1610 family)
MGRVSSSHGYRTSLIVGDYMSTITEYCPYCEEEVEMPAIFSLHECPSCDAIIAPCSICDIDRHICSQCPLETGELDAMLNSNNKKGLK